MHAALVLPPADTNPDSAQIDVLVLWTPAALAASRTEKSLHDRIDLAIAMANTRFANSKVNARLNLVYCGLINYTESGRMITDWNRLEGLQARGNLSRAVTLREDYKADIVYMLTETDNEGYGGVSWIPGASGDAEHAYGIVLRAAMGTMPVIFAHEVGHLLGAHHDREHAYDLDGKLSTGAFPYSYGHRFEVDGTTYVTTMGYTPGMYVPLFSNPNVLVDGVPSGVPAGQPGEADNARTLNQLAPYVANYKKALSRMEFTAPAYEARESDETIKVQLTRMGDLTGSTRVSVSVITDSTAKASVDYVAPLTSVITFAAGQASADFTFQLKPNDLLDGDRILHLALTAPAGTHGVGWQGETRVIIHDDEPSVAFEADAASVSAADGAVQIPLRLVGGFGSEESVEVALTAGAAGDTAAEGVDFRLPPEPVRFTPAARERMISIPILPNPARVSDQVFHLNAGGRTLEVNLINPDRQGGLDRIFAAGLGLGADLISLLPLAGGKLLAYGGFTNVAGEARTCLARLNPDGTLDKTFHSPELRASRQPIEGVLAPANRVGGVSYGAAVFNAAVQPDGKILIAGGFAIVDREDRHNLARLNSDGTLDRAFNPDFSIDGSISALLLQASGKIVLGGIFYHVNGKPHNSFVRLNPDGTLDPEFEQKPVFTGGILLGITALAEDTKGRILAGGAFRAVNGFAITNLVRLNLDGSVDKSFDIKGGASAPIAKIAALPNGQVMVSGVFDTIARQSYKKLVRLNANGSIDTRFRPTPAPDSDVNDFAVLHDGRVIVAGAFRKVSTAKTSYLTLLDSNGVYDSSFDIGSGPSDYCFSVLPHGSGGFLLTGLYEQFNHLPARGLLRIRWNDLKPLVRMQPSSGGTINLEITGYPGANYGVEGAKDLNDPAGWDETARVQMDGERAFLELPRNGDNSFVRLRVIQN